jgi:hypothetical protein
MVLKSCDRVSLELSEQWDLPYAADAYSLPTKDTLGATSQAMRKELVSTACLKALNPNRMEVSIEPSKTSK